MGAVWFYGIKKTMLCEILQVFLHVSHIHLDKEDLFYINFDQIQGVEEKKKNKKLGLVYYVCVYNRTV